MVGGSRLSTILIEQNQTKTLSCPSGLFRSGRKTTHGKGKRNAFFLEERAGLTVTRRR
jgi:hypothetical protein